MEVKFSDELLEQIDNLSGVVSPENTATRLIDFDEKGTVHIMSRDGEGKLLQDVPIKEIKPGSEEDSLYNAAVEEWRKKQEHNEQVRKRERVFYACLIILCVALALLVLKIR